MISHNKIKSSLKSDPENGLNNSDGETTACRKASANKSAGNSRYQDSTEPRGNHKRFRDERGSGSRHSGRSGGRGRGGGVFAEGVSKTRVFVESKSQESKGSDGGNVRPEDCRISKILRKLGRETDADKFLVLTKQLEEVLLLPDNESYLRHALELVTESLVDILRAAPTAQAKNEAARCLGRTGYALHSDFRRFSEWLFTRFKRERNEGVRVLFIKALMETALLEMQQPVLTEYAPVLMVELKMALEAADHAELMISCVDVILLLITVYPDSFNPYFRDTVDILVGWGLSLKEVSSFNFALRSLHQLERFWQADSSFALSLLCHFLEDTESCFEELESPEDEDEPKNILHEVITLLRLFNAVGACVSSTLASPSCVTQTACPSLTKLLTIVGKALQLFPSGAGALVTSANMGAALLLAQYHDLSPASIFAVLEYISKLMTLLPSLDDTATVSTLQFMTKVVLDLGPGLPPESAASLLGPGSPLSLLKTSSHPEITESLIQLYRSFLKQHLLFQEVIWLIKEDADCAVSVLTSADSVDSETLDAAAAILSFHLQAVAETVFTGEGVSVTLDLLLQWRPESPLLAVRCPALHHALLTLIHAYSARFNNFVSPGLFLQPEANYQFAAIVMVISGLLKEKLSVESVLLLVGWTRELLMESQAFLPVLVQLEYFLNLVAAVVSAGKFKYCDDVLHLVASCLQLVVGYSSNMQKPELVTDMLELCYYHANSLNPQVAAEFTNLLPCVPLPSTLKLIGEGGDALTTPRNNLLRSHISRGSHGLLSARNFKHFMDYLLTGDNHCDYQWLLELFQESYPLGLQNESSAALALKRTALQSRGVLLSWVCHEAAQVCVLNKLRTSLGKAPETFTAFETALKVFARETKNLEDGVCCVESLTRARLLLEFMECLEKSMYNASEGTAVTLAPAPPPVRTFFHANKLTCANWLTRMRLVMATLAVRAGQPAAAVRSMHLLLAELLSSRNTQGVDFETAVLYCAWALLNLRDSDAITGLYVWCKREADRKFPWLQPVALHASNKFELAIEGYKSMLEMSPSANKESNPADGTAEKCLANLDSTAARFVHDCLLDCYRKTDDLENLSQAIQNRPNIIKDNKNGTPIDRFIEPIWSIEDVTFLKNVQAVLINESSKYQWKTKQPDVLPILEPSEDIKALDESILDARICLPNNSEMSEKCKQTLMKLSDWSQVVDYNNSINWRTENLTESLRQAVIKDAMFIHVGKRLESKSFVFQMSENNKIEIDLHVNKLLEQWGVSHDFELSNVLKEVKERFLNSKNEILARVENTAIVVESLLRERLRSGRPGQARDIIVLDAVCRDLLHDGRAIQDMSVSTNRPLLSSDLLLQLSFWKRLLAKDDLKLHVLKAARKEGNFNLSRQCLMWHFKGNQAEDRDLADVCYELVENFDRKMTLMEGELCVQVAKLLNCTGANQVAMDFASLTALKLIRPDNTEEVRQCGSRLLVTLAKWLQRVEPTPPVVKNLIEISTVVEDELLSMPCGFVNDQQIISEHDMAIGRVLSMSVAHCPTLAKTWSQFASWCYRWGRKMVDATANSDINLSEGDLELIRVTLPLGATDEDIDLVVSVLSKTRLAPDEENIQTEALNTLETIVTQLRTVPLLAEASLETLATLTNIWRESQGRVSSAYRKAAEAYFKYLHLCSESQYSDTRTLTATLRILRLLVKHAVELQDLLEQELPTTPPLPWRGIIPQLFSRLNHPESYVRARLAELLCRLAQTAPNLIIFPAVVGSSAGANRITDINTSTSKLLSNCLSQGSDEDAEEEDDELETASSESQSSVLTNCYKSMVDILAQQMPEAVTQVKMFVSELRRITLLWDELWLGTLNQHHGSVTRRISQLEQEARKVDNNQSLSSEEKSALIAEKHRILMKPVVFVLEQLQAITNVAPETPHEIWFQEKLGDAINVALEKLKNPADPRDPAASWHNFRMIHAKLQKRAQKRACSVLKMDVICPVLHGFRNTAIPMPGVAEPNVTIKSVNNSILVLPTKTKPKKLVFVSNSGTTYTYLFKGLEDLHLDERIMQFLAIANTMLKNSGKTDYRARHYSVTPLGPRSGLISWVDRVMPLFTLYKKWQQRDSAAKQANSGQLSLRPSEMFYNKLTPLLKEAGVSIERRKEWPLPLLKQVLMELMKETPSDLLAKELWCSSIHVDDWWETTKRYTRSVAVMSVIGYVIGLGDRHLDNVLIDLQTGEMVHIDYNVCFEKGKTLRVPEKVPFRMTQNIREALGVTGVEGQFQLACEHVLKVLKHGRETLLPLLEAFVYDPLIDWTPGGETGYTGAVYGGGEAMKETRQSRKAVEREVTRAMFVVRVAEMKAEWIDNKEKILGILPEVVVPLEKYLAVSRDAQIVEECLADAHQQMLVVKEAEAVGAQHPLYSLPSRCSLLLKARSAEETLSVCLKEKKEEYDRDIVNYQNALREMTGEGLNQWMEHLTKPLKPDSSLMFDLVKQFLQTAGCNAMVTQCDQIETEIGQLDVKQRSLTTSCAELLAEYAATVALYPNRCATHRAKKFKTWCDHLLANPSITECDSIISEFKALYGDDRPEAMALAKQAATYSSSLQKAVAEAHTKLKRTHEWTKSNGCALEGGSLEESRSKLREMFKADKKSGLAVELVLISALCGLNQRFLKMESIAKNAEEGLEGMRLKDGQSWLEEMCVVSGLMTELVTLLPTSSVESASLQAALQTVNKTHSIFKELLELHVNFHSIILPEALKCTTTEHPDMMAMMADLRNTVELSAPSLEDLQKQLKLNLRALIMDMKSEHSDVQSRVQQLRMGLEGLLQRPCLDAGQSPGQMLLMGFHGMFERLALEGRQMIGMLTQIPGKPQWRKLDQYREASNFTALIMDTRTRSMTDDVFLVRRVQIMQEFFGLCEAAGAAFRGTGPPVVLNDDRLNRPIRRFAAEFVARIMLGATSQAMAAAICCLLDRLGFNVLGEIEARDDGTDGRVALDEICRRTVELSLQRGTTSNHLIGQATTAAAALQARYREIERAKMLSESVETRGRALTRLQTLLTAHSWHHEDALQEAGTAAAALANRSSFMTKLRKASSSLAAVSGKLSEAREGQRLQVASVEQRLRWAGGANPALVEVLTAFGSTITSLDRRLDQDLALAARVNAVCTAVMRHEALRTKTNEALIHDEAMIKMIEQCKEVIGWRSSCRELVTPAEESLLQLMTPESASDPHHLYKLELKIAENIERLKTRRSSLVEQMSVVRVECESEMDKLKNLLGCHHALMTEVRNPLKSMARFEEYGGTAIGDYLERYREFSEAVASVVSLLSSEKTLSPVQVESALNKLILLPDKIVAIYEDLVSFADKSRLESKKRPPLVRQESVCCSPKHQPPQPDVASTGKGHQERNAYALGVWRRIQMKLEGRDPDPGRRFAPHEQVDYIIQEATSLDNLALLYEGWTPWV